MTVETIKEYLVRMGFEVDKKSHETAIKKIQTFEKELEEIGESLAEMGKAFGTVTAGIAVAAVGVEAFYKSLDITGHKLGNITTDVDKFALSLYTTKENARGLQTVMDAMGIKSLEDLKFINLMPEQRQQFMELRALANELAPDDETKEGLAELRKVGFEFQKMQLEMMSIGTKFLGAIGNMMASPLFQKVPIAIQLVVDVLAFLVEKFKKNPVFTLLGGLTGSAAGGLAGAATGRAVGTWAGGALGGLIGPEGIPIGAAIGGAIGGTVGGTAGSAVGLPAGALAGGVVGEHKDEIKKKLQTMQAESKVFQKAIETKLSEHGIGHHSLLPGVKTSEHIKKFLSDLDSQFGGGYVVTSGIAGRSGGSWHPKGLAADLVPTNKTSKGYADLIEGMLKLNSAKKINIELRGHRYLAVLDELRKRKLANDPRLVHQITKDWTGEHVHATLRPTNVTINVNGAKSPAETAQAVKKTLNGMVLGGSVS